MSSPYRAVWLAGTAVVAAAGVAAWILWPGTEPEPFPERPEGVYAASDARSFTDIATMTASSALVVKGTVTATGPGETIEYDDGSGSVQTNREVTITVEDVLYNRYEIEEPATVVMVEGYWEDGVGYTREGMPWVEVGDSGYFYLAAPPPEHRESQTYSVIHLYGRVLLGEDQSVAVPGNWDDEGPWSAPSSLDSANAPAFESQILAAARAAAGGVARPEVITVCRPSDPENEDSEPICWEE